MRTTDRQQRASLLRDLDGGDPEPDEEWVPRDGGPPADPEPEPGPRRSDSPGLLARIPRPTWGAIWRSTVLVAVIGIGLPFLAFLIGWIAFKVPTADEAANNQVATIAYTDGAPLANLVQDEGNRIKVPLERVPVHVQRAVLAAEDRSFYSNPGFDPVGIARAAWNQARGGVGGGSTVTQQYVKNVLVGDDQTLWRKYREVVIAAKITQQQSKEEILGNYLNTIYFGRGAYGIQAASQSYFGRDVGQLDPAQGALLAGLIQSPSRWDPAVQPEDALRRWEFVLDGMVGQGWLSSPERAELQFPDTAAPGARAAGIPDDDRGHIVAAVREELAARGISERELNQEGLRITTTVDPELQRRAGETIRAALAGQPENLRAALISVDPGTGGIRAYYGGADGAGFDYAQARRQPGSAFKPFVVMAALDRNPPIGLGTRYPGTSPRVIAGRTVGNSEGESCGACDLRDAMTLSVNTVFYQLGVDVGPANVAEAANRAGVGANLANPSGGIALGDHEVRPGDMAAAYATFAAEGVYRAPHLVQRVTDAEGRVLFDTAPDRGERRMSPQLARNVTESLTGVAAHAGLTLDGGRPVAAKTGTVQSALAGQNNDAWMVGYTPSVSTAVWLGTDANTPIRDATGRPIFGRDLPGRVWQRYMDAATAGEPVERFSPLRPIGLPPGAGEPEPEPETGAGDRAVPGPGDDGRRSGGRNGDGSVFTTVVPGGGGAGADSGTGSRSGSRDRDGGG